MFFAELKETEQNQIVLDWVRYARLSNATNNTRIKCYLIPYHANEVNNEALEPLKEAVCTCAIMAVCGIGQERCSNIIGHSKKSATVKVHGNSNNSNATINSDSPVIRNLAEHFEKLESMAEVIATRTVREMTGEVLLRDTSDTKKYLPAWMTKQDSYRDYALKSGYEVTFNNRSHAISKWVGIGPEPERGIISFTRFCQYWKEHHGNIVVSIPSKDICSLCHALSNQHRYNLSHDMLFQKESDEVNDRGDATDPIAYNIRVIGTLMMKHQGR